MVVENSRGSASEALGARKRVYEDSEYDKQGDSKRRGCRNTLDRFLHSRLANMQKTINHRSPSALFVNGRYVNKDVCTPLAPLNNLPGIANSENIGPCPRRRGPSVGTLLRKDGEKNKSCEDKEIFPQISDISQVTSHKGRGLSIEKQLRCHSSIHLTPSQGPIPPLHNVHRSQSGGSSQSHERSGGTVLNSDNITVFKRKGRGLSIEKQIQMVDRATGPLERSEARTNASSARTRFGRGPNIDSLFNKEKSRVSGDNQSVHRTRLYSSTMTESNDNGHTSSAQTGSSLSGVKNLHNLFDEVADDQYNDEGHAVNIGNDKHGQTRLDQWEGYRFLGAPTVICTKCDAIMWNLERNNKSNMNAPPSFSLCYKNGDVILPKEKAPPEPLLSLLNGGEKSSHFRDNIRVYNSMFAMCSSGGKVDHKINSGGAPYCFKIRGTNMHFIGSLIPPVGEHPKFCQLYIYDTVSEVSNRLEVVGQAKEHIDVEIVRSLTHMLDRYNKLVKYFRTDRERFKNNTLDEFKLILISSQAENGRPNLIGPSNEIAGLIVNPDADTSAVRDVVVETHHKGLKRVYETDSYFMQLQFPLLFPRGEDGYHREIKLRNAKQRSNHVNEDNLEQDFEKKHREFVTLKEYYCSKLMIRPSEVFGMLYFQGFRHVIFPGHISLGAIPSSRVYFNLDIEPVSEMRSRLIEQGIKPGQSSSVDQSTNVTPVVPVSLAELVDSPESLAGKKFVIATFTVKKIEEEENWWFSSCTVCHDEVHKIERKFKCDSCNRSFPYSEKRFRILVLADDRSHVCNIILMDRIVKRMVGSTATNVLNRMKESGIDSSLPEFYKDIIGMEISAKILISEKNINGDSNIYEAIDFYDSSILNSLALDKSPQGSSSVFTLSGAVQGTDLFQTPGSSQSVSKKIKKEKDIVLLN